MRLLPRLLALTMAFSMLAACGWMNPRENDDYKEARAGRALTIPEGLDSPADASALKIPEVAASQGPGNSSASPPALSIKLDPIVPVSTTLTPEEAFEKVRTAIAGTSGMTVTNVQKTTRTLDVTTQVSQAKRGWWSRLTGRESVDRKGATRTVAVLSASGGGSAVAVQNARGEDDAAARRILTAIRQALR